MDIVAEVKGIRNNGRKDMKYKEVCKCKEKIRNSQTQEELENVLKNKSIDEMIELLKLCEVDLERKTEQKKWRHLIEKWERREPEKIKKFRISHKIYHQIKQAIEQEGFTIERLKKKDSLHAIMLITHLNFIFLEYCKENTEEYAQIRELIISYFNVIIQNYKEVKSNICLFHRIEQVHMDNELLTDLYSKLEAFSAYQKVLEILQRYQYNFLDFRQEGKRVKLEWNPLYDELSRRIAQRDFLDKHNVNNMSITNEFDEIQEKNCLFQDETVYQEKMKNFFMTDDLKRKMGDNFSIEEWIKIFVVLSKINTEYLENNHYKILIKTEKEWIKIFETYGFDEEKSKKILEELTFQKGDRDIREKPMLTYQNLYITIPSFVWTTDIYETLVRLFNHRKYQLNFKGTYFEEMVRERFEKAGVRNCQVKVNQHECDMAFVFDECLFICELKNEFQPLDSQSWYRFYKEEEKHIEQLEDIYNFYKENLQDIKKKLGKEKHWKPKKIYKVLMYANYLGETYVKDNLIISSYVNMINFFERAPICMNILKDKTIYVLESYNSKDYDYLKKEKSKLTLEDFLKYMRLPMSIWYQKEQYQERKEYIGIEDNYLIEIQEYEYKAKTLEEFITMNMN